MKNTYSSHHVNSILNHKINVPVVFPVNCPVDLIEGPGPGVHSAPKNSTETINKRDCQTILSLPRGAKK